MCNECYHSPCLRGCPNAPEPSVLGYCELSACKEDLYEGDKIYTDGCNNFCSLECAIIYHGIREVILTKEDN